MHVETQAPPTRRPSKIRRTIRLGGLALVVVAIGVGVWQLLGGGNDSERAQSAGVSLGRLVAFAGTVPHPVYWSGEQPGQRYELTETRDGRIYIRYLPAGAKVGDTNPRYLTVGTYPLQNAFETLKATAKKQGAKTISLDRGGLAFEDKNRPTSVYLAYPGSDYEVEVYNPSPATALKLVTSGRVAAIKVPGAEPASSSDLRALARKVGHPIYWAGVASSGRKYELTRTKDGSVYIRYLPDSAAIGDRNAAYLSIGTYPQKNAFAVLQAAAARRGLTTFKVPGGGLAYVDKAQPTSVYVAYPGSDYQVEVFDPSSARAQQLVATGKVTPLR